MTKRKERAGDISTRQRILMAGLEEFSTNGFSGARIESITKRADVNVRMIYHFFGNKRGLLDAVVGEIFRERQVRLATPPQTLSELLDGYLSGYAADRHRVRLLEWEALEQGPQGAALNGHDDRKDAVKRRLGALVRLQEDGQAPGGIDPEMLYLFCVALTIYPMSFPQSVYIATGDDAYSEKFQQRYRDALLKFADLLAPPPQRPET